MRRKLVIALHWAVVLLVLVRLNDGQTAPLLRWSFSGLVAVWVGIMVSGGILGRPGPKLTGWARAIYAPLHSGLYGLLGAAATLNVAELLHLIRPGPAYTGLLILLVAGTFHAIFHLWRHTTLYDGALRMITPRRLHKYL